MPYRSNLEIQASILEAAIGGALKTRLMYSAALSYLQMVTYLEELTGTGMIEYDSSIRHYRTTSKGIEFLKSFGQLNDLIAS